MCLFFIRFYNQQQKCRIYKPFFSFGKRTAFFFCRSGSLLPLYVKSFLSGTLFPLLVKGFPNGSLFPLFMRGFLSGEFVAYFTEALFKSGAVVPCLVKSFASAVRWSPLALFIELCFKSGAVVPFFTVVLLSGASVPCLAESFLLLRVGRLRRYL